MSSRRRNAEREAEHREAMVRFSEEQARLAARSMWERINDLDVPLDLKEILWEITAEKD